METRWPKSARKWGISAPDAVVRILLGGGAQVMNVDLYDIKNAEALSKQEWMMTCTDGFTPPFGKGLVHPRSYGSLTKKIASFVHDKHLISLPFAIRGMTSLGADFLGFQNRGLIKEGFFADLAVFDEAKIRDKATYENPHQYSEGTVHVIVNGQFAFRDGSPTGVLAGRPLSGNERHLER